MTTTESLNPTGGNGAAGARVVVDHVTVKARKSAAEVIQDISLSVAAGEILGVVGESGSGKTTLGLAMISYARRGLEISHGSVLVDGKDLGSLSDEELRALRGTALAYVPQDPGTALNPARRIGSQLAETLTAHRYSKNDADARIEELLDEVGLRSVSNVLQAYPHQLSGGQQQRVTLAMAFACRPGLIVLDEPTTGLDVTTQRIVLATAKQMCTRHGVAAIYVSHDILVVGAVADRVAVVYSGRVVEIGTTEEVFGSPQHPYTRGLLRAVPSPERSGRLVGMEGVPPRPGQRPVGCVFVSRCPVRVERCQRERPELTAAGAEHHLARCFLVGEVAGREPSSLREGGEAPTPGEPTTTLPQAHGAVLQVSGLDAHYGAWQVLHDVRLAVPPNTCVAVVGESGSGKTTLARCLAGLHTAWTGTITFEGAELPPGARGRSLEALRGMQYVFQNPYASLNPRRTIGGLLSQPLEHFTKLGRRDRTLRVVQAIESVSLSTAMLDRYPDQLSGGERQRVAIARALVAEPRILICDEVTSALDVSVQAAVVELLRRLQAEQNLSLLFITHNLAVVRSIAQQVVVMKTGQIVESGLTDGVLDNPQTDYTKQLLEDIPKMADATSGRRLGAA